MYVSLIRPGLSHWRTWTPQYPSLDSLWHACLAAQLKRPEPRRDEPAEQALWHHMLANIPTTPTNSPLVFSTTKGDLRVLGNIAASAAAQLHPAPGAYAISAACASGVVALIDAALHTRHGAPTPVAGADMAGSFVSDGFAAFKALSASHCRPFDAARDGLILGSAAASCLVRPALPEDITIAGFGFRCDAVHMTAPDRHARSLIAAIHDALAMANIPPADVDAILAHATGTRYNDAMEATAFRAVFGPRSPAITGIKGVIGHTLGAAGLIETAIACRMLADQTIPPMAGLQHSEYADLDLVIAQPRRQPLNIILKTASGFGGMNAALLLRQPTPAPPPQVPPVSPVPPVPPPASVHIPTKHNSAAIDTAANIRCIPPTAAPWPGPNGRDLPPIVQELARMAHALLAAAPDIPRDRIGIILGTHHGCAFDDALFDDSRRADHGRFASPAAFARTLPTTIPAHLGLLMGLRGPTFILSSGPASTRLALHRAAAWLQALHLPLILAGGFEQHSETRFRAALVALRPSAAIPQSDSLQQLILSIKSAFI